MPITEILAVGTGRTSSATRTVAAGAIERVGIKGATSESVGDTATATLDVAVDAAGTIFESNYVLSGEGRDVTRLVTGPCTYRITRTHGTIGAYVED